MIFEKARRGLASISTKDATWRGIDKPHGRTTEIGGDGWEMTTQQAGDFIDLGGTILAHGTRVAHVDGYLRSEANSHLGDNVARLDVRKVAGVFGIYNRDGSPSRALAVEGARRSGQKSEDEPTITANPEPGVLVRLVFSDGSSVDLTVDATGHGLTGSMAWAWSMDAMQADTAMERRLGEALAQALRENG